jgi:tRNA A-37 threonylcarbamoyl transferase component Bud32
MCCDAAMSGRAARGAAPGDGCVIAAGRASEIVALGGNRVLRRLKAGADPALEAEMMTLAALSDYPVPRIDEMRADGLVLELVLGPTMAEDARRKPWRFAAHARTLAQLHDRLHRVRLPDGQALLHLDLHWKNVLLSQRGPVVIDWANARPGRAALDPALTWVILMSSAGRSGRAFGRLFARQIDVRTALREAIEYRLADRNLTDAERTRVAKLGGA